MLIENGIRDTTEFPEYTLTNLTEKSYYDFYVRMLCSDSVGWSEWSEVLSFRTCPTPEPLPLRTGFEEDSDNSKWTLLNGTQKNRWVIDCGVNHSGRKCLYISSDSAACASQIYTSSNAASYVYAYRTLQFEVGTYDISFDWQCVAEGGYDLGRVCLVILLYHSKLAMHMA